MSAKKIVFRIIYIAASVLAVILILMFLLWVGRRGYEFGYRIFTETAASEPPGKDVVVLIRSDMSKRDVAKLLEEKGLVKDDLLFLAQYALTDYDKIEPGTYTMNTSMSVHEIAELMEGEAESETESEEEKQELLPGDELPVEEEVYPEEVPAEEIGAEE